MTIDKVSKTKERASSRYWVDMLIKLLSASGR
jgi:hypothetical protein